MTELNREEKTEPQASTSAFTMLQLLYGAASPQFGYLYLPTIPGPHPVVILIHGGFWRAAYGLTLMTALAENLVETGIAVWNIEYRRVGDIGGGWPGTLQDVARATDALSELAPTYDLDLQRVVTVGHSAGGHLALWLAARPHIPAQSQLVVWERPLALKGCVSLAGAMDLEYAWQLNLGHGAVGELLGGSPTDVPERYATASPAEMLPLDVPQVLVHGTKDDRVPLIVSQEYARKADEAGDNVKLLELADADHFVLIDPTSDAWAVTVQEIQALLGMENMR